MSSELFVGPEDRPDKYRLVREVGRGGEGMLHLAEVVLAGAREPVIVKALHAEIAADEQQFGELGARWAEQAELLRFINVPGVVGIREYFQGPREHPAGRADPATRSLYLVMNYVAGVPLRAWRKENPVDGPQAADAVLAALERTAEVIDHLHSGRATPSGRPVVHGDLSPGNIMLGGAGEATLVDFGLSRISARHVTRTPWFTPGYAAPEVFVGEYSPATDRYAFGGIVYYALRGENPPPSPEQVRQAFQALPPLAAAPPERRERILSMFSVEPDERPGTGAWIRELRALAAGRGESPAFAAGAPVPPPAPRPPAPQPPDTVPEGPAPHAAPAGPQAGAAGPGRKGSGAKRAALVGGAAVLALALFGGGGAAAWALLGGEQEPGRGGGGQAAEPPGAEPERGGSASASASASASPSAKAEEEKEEGGKEEERVNERPGSPLSDRSTILPAQEYGSGEAVLDGVRYQESLTVSGACGKPSAEYNLGRGSSSFAATVGVDDGSSGPRAVFTVVGDGKELASATAGPGSPAEISADVSGVLRLRLTVEWSGDCSGAVGVWGDPKLT
ncbi:NPCBM/NEW2 domain-containing protein [Nocardiopsis sp. CNT-189]|uniref:protein kinase domain-containing protein n=1 Tax=Nocardiopsis oceanisediminis TaxID=2816862 RepID=UPI003B37CDA7